MEAPHKRSQKLPRLGHTGGDYTNKTRKVLIDAQHRNAESGGGKTKTVAGNPHTGMGVGKGKSVGLEASVQGGLTAGRARTRKGKNNT